MELADRPDVDISASFRTASMWIRAGLASREEARVMVNCWQGASRSATVVLAFIIIIIIIIIIITIIINIIIMSRLGNTRKIKYALNNLRFWSQIIEV